MRDKAKQYLQTSWDKAGSSKAYVLIDVTRDSESQVVDAAKALGILKKACYCFGMYDLVLEIEAESLDDLKHLIAHEYRTIKGLHSILVLPITGVISKENFNEDKKKLKIFV